MTDWILPYPNQLPLDYYTKNLPGPAPVPAPVQPSLPQYPAPVDPTAAVNNGGIWYGDIPPNDPNNPPQNGWLWANTQGQVYMYMDPGVWSQLGTNW